MYFPNAATEDPPNNLVVLQVDRTFLKCSKGDLIKHSDYFKAMFNGNFVESSKNIIPLDGVEVDAMVAILKMLRDREYVIKDEHLILSALQAACMLQFLEIKEKCIRRVLDVLSARNCLKIWMFTAHFGLKTVYLKAKLIALLEFMTVKDCDYFVELSLEQVVNYLGNRNLQCSDEMAVFDALVEWYFHTDKKNHETMLKLLHCLDFTGITENQIEEDLINCATETHPEVISVLRCILAIRRGSDLSDFNENCIQKARSLLKSKNRNLRGFPCILVDNVGVHQQHDKNTGLSVICINRMPTLKKLFDFDPQQKCANLEGFKVLGYKNFVYLFGGEYGCGTDNWNLTFYIYDTITEKWDSKDTFPVQRRHFEACICGDYLYVIGGIGPYQFKNKNMFWYHLIEEKWSRTLQLPFGARKMKCCNFNDNLFILDIKERCGYAFNPDTTTWTQWLISGGDEVLPQYSKELSVFSYKSSLYIKGNQLIKLKFEETGLSFNVQRKERRHLRAWRRLHQFQVEPVPQTSVLCNNILYSLKEQSDDNAHRILLESFDVDDSHEVLSIIQNTKEGEFLEVDNGLFIKFRQYLTIFSVFHHSLVDENDLINDFL